jgi:excisionase family DNA binding protein
MSRIINLGEKQKSNKQVSPCEQSEMQSLNSRKDDDADYVAESLKVNMEIIKSNFPAQVLFTISEVANITKVSYEFIRQRIVRGKIKHRAFGERKLIHINELCRIISGGI